MDDNYRSILWRGGLRLAIGLILSLSLLPRGVGAQQSDRAGQALLKLHSRIAWQTLNRGDLPRAEAMFRDILRRDGQRPREIAGLSAALARQGKIDEAIEVLQNGVDRFPLDATLASALGQAYLNAQDNQQAMDWLEQAYSLDPTAPDIAYFLGSSYLACQFPLSALNVMCSAPTSREEMRWAQDLGIGAAFGQLGLQCEASGYFMSVANEAQGTSMADSAVGLNDQMDEAMNSREYLRGSVKVTARYDDNPGVIPAAGSGGGALAGVASWGNLYQASFSYDIVRDYNYDATVGYNFYHTSNYDAHAFDVVNNGVYLATDQRVYWNCKPVHLGARLDYDHLFVGSADFLQRMVATPSLTFVYSDWVSTTLLMRYTLFDFLGQGLFNNSPFDLDGDNLAVGITRQRLLLCRDLTVFAGYEYDQNLSDGSNYDYGGHKLQVGAQWKTPLAGLLINAAGDVHFRGYDHAHSVFGINRYDEEFTVHVTLLKPLCPQWWASLEWSFDRNNSNIATNDYRRHTLDIGLEYRFP